MRRRRRYKWNILGNHCGFNIIRRLKWINGKPMVFVAILNVLLILIKKFCMEIPEVQALTSTMGWGIFVLLAKAVFWILFVDGIIVNFLWSFTRGRYHCSYFVRLFRYPELDNKSEVQDDLAWAWFLHTHPDFDYRMQELKNIYFMDMSRDIDEEGYDRAFRMLVKEYGVIKADNGRYYCRSEKKYKDYLSSEKKQGKKYLKYILLGVVILLAIYLLSFFLTKTLTLYQNLSRTSVETEADEPRRDTEMEDALEEELDFVEEAEENQEIDLRDQLIGSETLIEITSKYATIYSDADSQNELDTATLGMQFIGTGEVQVNSSGSAWCEIYINSLRKKKAWVSIYDVKQIID